MIKGKIPGVKFALDSLSVYRGLLKDNVISKFNSLLEYIISDNRELSSIINKYNDFYYSLVSSNSTNTFKSYLINCILFDDNVFSRSAEIKNFNEIDVCIKKAAGYDLLCLQKVALLSAGDIKDYLEETNPHWSFETDIIASLPTWDFNGYKINYSGIHDIFEKFNESEDWSLCTKDIADFYRLNGTGIFAKYKGFVWERQDGFGNLKGIESPDPIRIADLIGYNSEREIIIKNTLNFLNGYPSNNILLYGERGTGKSSTVKAILNEYYDRGLRIIELPIMLLPDFPQIIKIIKDRPQKFIIFIDDLAFGDNEESYTALKAILEGGLESRPKNTVIYATSNRRHLIKERFSDRQDEVHASDTIQEKLSLSDRFGITVTYLSPDRNKYIEIVEGLVKNRGLIIDKEHLKKEAQLWEMRYNGRSPRTAKQFVDWLEGELREIG